MITFQYYRNSLEKRQLLDRFDVSSTTWVVSDLPSKLALQKRLLSSGIRVLPGNSVLRASEVWAQILEKIDPEISTVSHHLIIALVQEALEDLNVDWVGPQSASKIVKLLDQFLPIIGSKENTSLVLDWLRNNEESALKWGAWFGLCHQVWTHLKENNLICSNWVSSLLSTSNELTIFWKRKLVIDLGVDLSPAEAQIIEKLSTVLDVQVLVPLPSWAQEQKNNYVGYYSFTGSEIISKVNSEQEKYVAGSAELKRFTTMIGEVKDAVSTVRNWIEKGGVKPKNIAIIAPDIELYWPALGRHLRIEHIPVQKRTTSSLQCFPEIVNWISLLKLSEDRIVSGNAEGALYSQKSYTDLGYESFTSKVSLIYENQDFKRVPDLNELVNSFGEGQKIVRDEFISWAEGLWKWGNLDLLSSVIQKISIECPKLQKFELKIWISYVESICTQLEYDLGGSIASGIQCINIENNDWSDFSHIYILGLLESAITSVAGLELSSLEVSKLSTDLGLNLSTEDQNSIQFDVSWLLQSDFQKIIVSVPATNFSGSVEEPALIWLKMMVQSELDTEFFDRPGETFLDRKQTRFAKNFFENREWNGKASNESLSIGTDLGLIKPIKFGEGVRFTLSASKLERFTKCPFIFTAGYLFKLEDIADLDLDIDRMNNGRFMHKLFEDILANSLWHRLNDDELFVLVDNIRKELPLILADEKTWKIERKKYVTLAQRFIQFEKQWRTDFPDSENLGREVVLSGFWNPDEQTLEATQSSSKSIKFRGIIDRIDGDRHDNCVVIDYKSSGSSAKNIGSWVEAQLFQLALYSNALKRGLTLKYKCGQVVSAVYFDAKKMDRGKGFGLKGFEGKHFKDSRAFSISEKNYQAIEKNIFSIVGESVNRMLEGDFGPNPIEKVMQNDCISCNWRGLCRASHLN